MEVHIYIGTDSKAPRVQTRKYGYVLACTLKGKLETKQGFKETKGTYNRATLEAITEAVGRVVKPNYIKNLRIAEGYRIEPDEDGHMHYILDSGIDIQELDGISLYQAIEKERAFEPKLLCIGGKVLILSDKTVLFCTKTRLVYKADHKVVAIKPYRFLTLEVESLWQ